MAKLSNKNATQTVDHVTAKRPRQITALGWLFLLVGIFHFLKFIQVVRNIDLLWSLPLAVSPRYLAADGIVWGIIGLILTWGVWKGKNWSGSAAMILSILYNLAFWADRIWIAQPEGLAQRWLVNLFLTVIGLGSIYLILNHKTSRAFFGKNPAKIP